MCICIGFRMQVPDRSKLSLWLGSSSGHPGQEASILLLLQLWRTDFPLSYECMSVLLLKVYSFSSHFSSLARSVLGTQRMDEKHWHHSGKKESQASPQTYSFRIYSWTKPPGNLYTLELRSTALQEPLSDLADILYSRQFTFQPVCSKLCTDYSFQPYGLTLEAWEAKNLYLSPLSS